MSNVKTSAESAALLPDASDPCAWTATKLSAAFGDQSLTPAALLDAVLERCTRINPRINAIVTFDIERARRAAEESTLRWKDGRPLSPLDGIPITIKDNLFQADVRATWGSRAFESFVPTYDEPPVARLRAAGAVLFGKTNVPEFTLTGHTTNAVFGTTLNPLAPGRSAGGSSGGAAAAVAAGLGPLALGTDGGGSLRRPAAHCGLYALKPSIGQVARYGGFPSTLHDMETVGPITRSVADLEMVFAALRGFDRRDPRSLAALSEPPSKAGKTRLAYFRRFGSSPVDPAILAAADTAATRLAAAGFDVETPDLPFDAEEVGATWSLIASVGAATVLASLGDASEVVGPGLRKMSEDGARVSGAQYAGAIASLQRWRAEAADFFDRWGLLLSPTVAAGAWPAEKSFPAMIDGRAAGPRGHAVFTGWANAVGAAGVTIPIGRIPEAGGIGMQVLAAAGTDIELLRQAGIIDRLIAA